MRIFLTGSAGQVGHELARALAPLGELVATDRAQCDLADPSALRACVREVQPQLIVNAAAYTAVDQAEREPELAHAINALAPGVLAEEAARLGALLVHYSTDYVFDGCQSTPYSERDTPHPLNVYGHSKWAGEQAIARSGARALVVRTSWVYGVHGRNFIKAVLRKAAAGEALRVVNDQHGAPTSAALIAAVTAQMAVQSLQRPEGLCGTYHLSARGATTWYELARFVVRAAQGRVKLKEEDIESVSTAQYRAEHDTMAVRPMNSLLDTTQLQHTFALELPEWSADVAQVVEQLLLIRPQRT